MRWLALTAVVGALAAGPGPARAGGDDDGDDADGDGDGPGDDRFFVDKTSDDGDGTLWQGSLTSSTFYFHESGGQATAVIVGGAQVDNASPFSRLFTELRAQLDGRHLKGGRWDLRADSRVRVVNNPFGADEGDANRIQSGTYGDNEYELRELYLVRSGERTDLFVGRQVVADMAAIKIDGLRVDYAKNARWTYLGFAGLYPLRGSRSLTTDYPRGAGPMGEPAARVTPVAGGFGAAYRTQRTYGALGAAAIVPTRRDAFTGTYARPRVLVTGNGYARRGPRLDLFHYLVVDLYGEAGFAVTNASLGVNWKPHPRLRVNASANRVDTEVLGQQIRNQLENVDANVNAVINNLEAQRIAADSVKATVSGALGGGNRWELSSGLTVRRRPEVILPVGGGGANQTLPAARDIELLIQAVDRRFYGGLRLDASFIRSVGLGGASYARSTVQIARLGASRELAGGKAEVQADLTYARTADDNAGATCTSTDITTCYGSANTSTVQANAIGYYRFRKNWFATGSLTAGTLKITTTSAAGGNMGVPQSTVVNTSLFARIGYRF